jgi:hypothetical protein
MARRDEPMKRPYYYKQEDEMENFPKYNEIILTFYSLPWITECKFQKNWSTRRKVIA